MKKTMLFTLAMLCLPTVGLKPGIIPVWELHDYRGTEGTQGDPLSCATAIAALASFATVLCVTAAANNPSVGTIGLASASGLVTTLTYVATVVLCLQEPARQERLAYASLRGPSASGNA